MAIALRACTVLLIRRMSLPGGDVATFQTSHIVTSSRRYLSRGHTVRRLWLAEERERRKRDGDDAGSRRIKGVNTLVMWVGIILDPRDLENPQFETAFGGLEEDLISACRQHVPAADVFQRGNQMDCGSLTQGTSGFWGIYQYRDFDERRGHNRNRHKR